MNDQEFYCGHEDFMVDLERQMFRCRCGYSGVFEQLMYDQECDD